MNIKMELKQEPCFPCIYSESGEELCSDDHLMEVKNETVTCHSDYKMDPKTEIKEESFVLDFCLRNERDHFTNEQNEADIKIEFKEEKWWLKSSSKDVPYHYDEIKDGTADDFPPTQSPRLYEDRVTSDMSALIPNENFGKDKGCNVISESAESVFTEQPETGKMDSSTSCFKQNSLILQSKTNKHNDCEKYTYRSILVRDALISEYKCDICEKSFTSLSDLKLHNSIHEGRTPHSCDTCGKGFSRLSNLKKHKFIHKGTKPHKCDTCGKSFATLGNFKRHKVIHVGTKPHKCDKCGKCFTQLSYLKKHKLVHEGTKPHLCNNCGKGFIYLSQLRTHNLLHEGTKPHKCDICGKGFTDLSYLRRHKLIHEDTKPHKCNNCGRGFTQFSNLRTHKLIHEGTKPHKCDNCGKGFTQLSHLRTHKLIHEGIKPYKCDNCGKCFNQSSNLRTHKLIHDGSEPLK